MEGIADIELYPIIGLIIFFIMFVALLYVVAQLTKGQVEEFSHLPLDNENDQNNETMIQ